MEKKQQGIRYKEYAPSSPLAILIHLLYDDTNVKRLLFQLNEVYFPMKVYLHTLLGVLTAFCLMFTLLITSIEAVCYWVPDYYQTEYEKYQVLDNLPAMTMEDLLTVTREMMAYLRGNREDLHVWTNMGGEYREFFTQREIAHMEDVRGLFLAAIFLRRLCLITMILCIGVIYFTKGSLRRVLPKTIFWGTLLFFGITGVLGLIVSTNFSKYFVVFHHIFFDNDLWILDPSVDMLINIVPEPFFMDTAFYIIVTYGILALLVLGGSFWLMKRTKGRLLPFFLLFCLVLPLYVQPAYADTSWPQCQGIQADGGILIDADSNAVLYEKNADQPYYPASITKILTALIIIENCDLEEMVTFSDNAINNVESNSSNMGAMVGDVLSVRDCLYGLMLASANESANALAEHCSGSIEAFTELMNQKARELGCTGSHFANPSGLNNENHYVTARDMALIMRAAIANPTFVEIDGARYWTHAPIKRYPDPEDPHNTVYAHHGMLKKNDARYYAGTFAGKTGYTSLAGNTLVTSAKKNGLTLIAVILNGHQTHYQDTKTLFDFGFRNFKTVKISDYDQAYSSIENDMTFSGLTVSPGLSLSMENNCSITLPQSADFQDVEAVLGYEMDALAPADALARISYTYGGRDVGFAYLKLKDRQNTDNLQETAMAQIAPREAVTIPEPTTRALEEILPGEEGTAESAKTPRKGRVAEALPGTDEFQSEDSHRITIPSFFWIAAGIAVLLITITTAFFLIKASRERKEEQHRYLFNERRKQRLNDIGFSQNEFELMLERNKRNHGRRHFR